MIAAFASNHQDDWDLWIDSVVFAYNTSRQEATGVSPYEIVVGRAPRLLLELELGVSLSSPTSQSEYTRGMRSVFREIREIARNNLERGSVNRQNKNQSRVWEPFRQGHFVMVKRPQSWKFGNKWIGPLEVVHRIGVDSEEE
jgi:hypothetical protein